MATIADDSVTKTAAAPTTDAMIANKKYVDDSKPRAYVDRVYSTSYLASSYTLTFSLPAGTWLVSATFRATCNDDNLNSNELRINAVTVGKYTSTGTSSGYAWPVMSGNSIITLATPTSISITLQNNITTTSAIFKSGEMTAKATEVRVS